MTRLSTHGIGSHMAIAWCLEKQTSFPDSAEQVCA
jgi:hypothetical protein